MAPSKKKGGGRSSCDRDFFYSKNYWCDFVLYGWKLMMDYFPIVG